MRATQVSERARPITLRIDDGGGDAMGIGVVPALGESARDERLGEIGPAQREQPARALIEDMLRGKSALGGRQSFSN